MNKTFCITVNHTAGFVFNNPFGASISVIHLQFDKRTNTLALQGKVPGTSSVKDGMFLD